MRRVFVLGAGASKGLNPNAPLMANLLPEALKFAKSDGSRSTPSTMSANRVTRFIAEFYNVDSDQNLPPFEDVLSQVDYCIINNLPLSRNYSVEELRKLRNDLIYIMGRVIQVALEGEIDRYLTYSFLRHLIPGEDAIISLNYDLIVDNAMGDAIDYRLPFRNTEQQPSLFSLNVPLYKLHGSLNWLYCPVCRELETTIAQKAGLEPIVRDVRCEKCHTRFEPVLITPTFLKDYNNSFIVQLWHEAQNQLHDAGEVIFVGYGMPDADIVLRMFFTRALYTNYLRNKRRCRVTVVNWVSVESPEQEPTTKQRYEQIFGAIDYDPTGFAGYILRGCSIQRSALS